MKNQKHYTHISPQPIEVISKLDLGFSAGNVIKYLYRAGYKDSVLDDLKKVAVYLEFLEEYPSTLHYYDIVGNIDLSEWEKLKYWYIIEQFLSDMEIINFDSTIELVEKAISSYN